MCDQFIRLFLNLLQTKTIPNIIFSNQSTTILVCNLHV